MNRPLIVIVGPTAAGKSELGVAVAEALGGEVLSADAMQVYRGLDIGTGKVGAELRRRVPHHGIDLVEPTERYSAGRYARYGHQVIAEIEGRGRYAVVVGGTGFYIQALVEGLAPLPPREDRWRRALSAVAERRGLHHLFRILDAHDPAWARKVGSGDRQRILRGLEMCLRTGLPFSELLDRRTPEGSDHDAIRVAVTWPRSMLYERIEARIDEMLERGWIEEVEALLDRGVPRTAHAMQAIGYRELARHLAGEISLDEAVETIARATRRYAKRQLTWFRGQTEARWFERVSEDPADRERLHRRVLDHLRNELG